MDKSKDIGFLQIPTQIIKDKALRDVDGYIYGVIVYRSHELGYCWSSNKDLAEQIGRSATSITDCLARLESAGYITRENKTSKKRRLIPKLIIGVIKNSESNDVNLESNNLTKSDEPKSCALQNINTYININNNINNIVSLFRKLYKMNYGTYEKYNKANQEAIKLISEDKALEVLLTRYITEYLKPVRDKYLPIGITPATFVEKLPKIESYFSRNSASDSGGADSLENLFNSYNK